MSEKHPELFDLKDFPCPQDPTELKELVNPGESFEEEQGGEANRILNLESSPLRSPSSSSDGSSSSSSEKTDETKGA